MSIETDNIKALMEDCKPKIRDLVGIIAGRCSKIRWKSVSFIIPTKPVPSHRPRISGFRFYVPGATKNAAFFEKKVLPTLNGLFITTPCKMKLDIYVETPKSFTRTQKCLAELKYLRPWTATGDVDNFCKAVMDQMQPNAKRGNTGILMDDRLVIESHENKYYSITPRYEVTLSFMNKIPDELIKVLRLGFTDVTEETT